MSPAVDDYYSSISSTSWETSTKNDKKPPVIKKKLKLRKKVDTSEKPEPKQEEVLQNSDESVSLNDTLEQESWIKFKIVSRAWDDEASSSDTPTQDIISTRQENIVEEDTSSDKKVKKFKTWFSKPTAKKRTKNYENNQEESSRKKTKIYGQKQSKKYKHTLQEDDAWFTRSNTLKTKKKEEKRVEDIEQTLKSRAGETVMVPEFLSVKEFSEKIGIPLSALIAEFMKNGLMVTLNSPIDFDTASLISEAFEVTLQKESQSWVAIDELVEGNIKELLIEEDMWKLQPRPPVISIMGHVDHGKTSLLDHIRKSQIASWEAWGITQSIWAYQVEYNNTKITFLDTPGHEAFTIMRSRGAKSTDIAILVVAADEWVKPQTIESISHAREAGIPIVVAINKMDKEGANPDHVKWQLAEQWLTPEDWGGETPMVPISAQTGFGIDELLEIITLVAEMQELTANPERQAVATIIESHLDTQLGPVATALINTGKIQKGDAIVSGGSFGKVKVLKDFISRWVKYGLPWDPVFIVGLDKVVEWWDILQVVSWIDIARQKSTQYQEYIANQKTLNASQLDILMSRIKSGNLKHLKIVLKADTNGSLEAIKNSLLKLSTEETSVSIIHSGVWNITEGDVVMSEWSDAILVGFWVNVGPNAKRTLLNANIEFIESRIIYHITERIEKIITGMLDPKEVEIPLCFATVKEIFYTAKQFLIVWVWIPEDEYIENGALVRVIRGDKVVGRWRVDSLQQWVEEVQKIEGPVECGIKLSGTTDIQEKDTLEVYKIIIQT